MLEKREKAYGCILGQLIGDSLGSQVEFNSADWIKRNYPNGVREMTDGGTFNLLAGQSTDDSELAILLLRSLVDNKGFDQEEVLKNYIYWMSSSPFDCGNTIYSALADGIMNYESQANGALMRVSPIGIYGASVSFNYLQNNIKNHPAYLAAIQDAELTHPNKICLQVNGLFALCLSEAITNKHSAESIYEYAKYLAKGQLHCDEIACNALENAKIEVPATITTSAGWCINAFQLAFYLLLNSQSFEDAMVDCINLAGDTDTNAAIAGSLLGAVYGKDYIPNRYIETVLNCKPSKGNTASKNPRPEILWATDCLELVDRLFANELNS